MEKTRLTLRLPPDLADQAAAVAEQQGLTMNAFIVQAVRNWATYQGKRMGPSIAPVVSASREPPPVQNVPKAGANDPCPCGSGQNYKRCHGRP
jgi:uncharacterized protein YecA (UPF0149 family)